MTAGTGIRRLDAVGAIEARYDLVIIGAGPAGMSAAIMAAGHGLSVLVADRSREEGGQIYRGVATVPKNRARLLGSDYEKGAGLAAEFRETPCDYLPNATVWFLDGTPQIGLSAAGESRMVSCRHVILATGAMERPMPVSGWTLPGVMTVGAADTAQGPRRRCRQACRVGRMRPTALACRKPVHCCWSSAGAGCRHDSARKPAARSDAPAWLPPVAIRRKGTF